MRFGDTANLGMAISGQYRRFSVHALLVALAPCPACSRRQILGRYLTIVVEIERRKALGRARCELIERNVSVLVRIVPV
jgi:hypothetical protein